jgi:hypothetical protein
MAAPSVRNQHRHFKTLILLVVSMTVGTVFLYWIDEVSPSHRKSAFQRLAAASASPWNSIDVRTENADDGNGFHFHIDPSGRLFRSRLWSPDEATANSNGVIQILVTPGPRSRGEISRTQQDTLARLIDQLSREYRIPPERIRPAVGG